MAMLWSGDADAADPTEVVVVGTHVSSSTGAEVDRLSATISSASGFSVVGPEEVQRRLQGRGPRLVDEALQERGRNALAEGKVLFEHADLEAAGERIAASIEMLEVAMAGSTDSKYLIDALLVQGNIGLAMGNVEGAKSAYRRVVQLDPERKLDPVNHPPKVVSLYTEVRQGVLAVPRGSMRISVDDPKAQIVIDGRQRGVGPTVLSDIVPGDHHVLVTGANGHRDYERVTVSAGERAEVVAYLADFFISPTPENESDRAEQVAVVYRTIADQITEGWIVMGGELGIEEVGLQVYEARTGNSSRIISGEVGANPHQSIADLAKELVTLRSPEGLLDAKSVSSERLPLNLGANRTLAQVLFDVEEMKPTAPVVPSRRGPVPWPVWAGVGTAVVGGVVAAIVVGSAKSTAETKEVSNETGTITVRF